MGIQTEHDCSLRFRKKPNLATALPLMIRDEAILNYYYY